MVGFFLSPKVPLFIQWQVQASCCHGNKERVRKCLIPQLIMGGVEIIAVGWGEVSNYMRAAQMKRQGTDAIDVSYPAVAI